jgi:hypothetical protein
VPGEDPYGRPQGRLALKFRDRGPRRPRIGSRPSREETGDPGGSREQAGGLHVQFARGPTRIAGGEGTVSLQGNMCMLPTTLQAVPGWGEAERSQGDLRGRLTVVEAGRRRGVRSRRWCTVKARGCREGDSHNVSLELTP